MLRAAQWIGAGNAQRVQKSSAQGTRAVIEVIHQYLQLNGEVHVVHRRAEWHRHDLRGEVQNRVNVGFDHSIGNFFGRTTGRGYDALVRGRRGINERLDHEPGHFVSDHRGIVVVERDETGPSDQKVRRVHERAPEIADAHDDHVVETVVAEGFGDGLDQDVDVVTGTPRAK